MSAEAFRLLNVSRYEGTNQQTNRPYRGGRIQLMKIERYKDRDDRAGFEVREYGCGFELLELVDPKLYGQEVELDVEWRPAGRDSFRGYVTGVRGGPK